jgi:hypothetical protein
VGQSETGYNYKEYAIYYQCRGSTLQTITAASKINKTLISPADFITFFIEEAEHRVIEGAHVTADASLVAYISRKSRRPRKTHNSAIKITDVIC